MGCNCKNKYKSLKKYADDASFEEDGDKLGFFGKILKILVQICFGILCGALIIVMLVPMLIYIIVCLIIGRNIKFNLRRFNKKQKKQVK